MRRRLVTLAVVAVGVVAAPAAALAYPAPSGQTAALTVCPAYPADIGFGTNPAVVTNGPSPSVAAGGSWSAYGNGQQGGPGALVVTASSGIASGWSAMITTAGGRLVASTGNVTGSSTTLALPYVPIGNLNVTFYNTGAGTAAGTFDFTLYTQGDRQEAAVEQVQAAVDGCDLSASSWATQHADQLAIKAAVGALTANGTTLDTLHADLATLHTDMGTLEGDVVNSGGSGSSGTQAVSLTGPVQLSSADRQLAADVASQTDGDLWVIVGVMVGCFCTGFILNRFFPA